jgi:ubiquinone/menaquinone biosynthesis C-methylase UbiE
MDHNDHVNLLRDGVPGPGGVWADLGAGSGAFTLALAELIGPTGKITAIDKNRRALQTLKNTAGTRYPGVQLTLQVADFSRPLHLPPFDGVVMANSLHFLSRTSQKNTLQSVYKALRPAGRLIVVEYDTDQDNTWVPYPLSFPSFEHLASQVGYTRTTLLRTRPSRFLRQIYSACSLAAALDGA